MSTQGGLESTSISITGEGERVMDIVWKVVTRIGRRMTLERGQEQRMVREPVWPYAKQLFHMTRPGQVIDTETVELFVSKKPKRSRKRVSR